MILTTLSSAIVRNVTTEKGKLNEKISQLQTANQTLNTEKGALNQQISQLQAANHYLQNTA